MKLRCEVSLGELLDKIAILRIKEQSFDDPTQLEYVKKELNILESQLVNVQLKRSEIDSYINQLVQVNKALWYVVWRLRTKIDLGERDEKLTRTSVALVDFNNRRADIKREADERSKSDLREQKGFTNIDLQPIHEWVARERERAHAAGQELRSIDWMLEQIEKQSVVSSAQGRADT
jgi:hypothetical protein